MLIKSRSELLNVAQEAFKTKQVDIEGTSYALRELSAASYEEVSAEYFARTGADGKIERVDNWFVLIVARSLVGEDGTPLFDANSPEDVALLGKTIPERVMKLLYNAANEMINQVEPGDSKN